MWCHSPLFLRKAIRYFNLLIEMESKKKTNATTRTRRTLTLEAKKQAERED
jgi:hypothetical protein